MHSQKVEAKRCFGCRPNARPRYWSDTLNKSAFWCQGPLLVHQNVVFFPCPSFPSRLCQWHFSAFPTERGTQGLKPELPKPILGPSGGPWKIREAEIPGCFSGYHTLKLFLRQNLPWPSATSILVSPNTPAKNSLNKQKFWWQHAHFKVYCPCSRKSVRVPSIRLPSRNCKDHSLSHVCAAVFVEKA